MTSHVVVQMASDREDALDTLARLLERRLKWPNRGKRSQLLAFSAWSLDAEETKKEKESVPKEDVTACKDAVRVLLGKGKKLDESTLRKELRELVHLNKLPSASSIRDKRLSDIVDALRKRVSSKLDVRLTVSSPSSSSEAPAITTNTLPKTPRQEAGASISYEESLRRRVHELEKQLEDARQSLEKLVRE